MYKVTRVVVIVSVSFLLITYVSNHLDRTPSSEQAIEQPSAASDVQTLAKAYQSWQSLHERDGGDENISIALGWSKGLSTEFTRARGAAKLDLMAGRVSAEINGLETNDELDLWLVDNQSGSGKSVKPEEGDRMLRLGRLQRIGEVGKVQRFLGERGLEGFELDLVVLSRAGQNPGHSVVLAGAPSFFQRTYTRNRRAAALGYDSRHAYGLASPLVRTLQLTPVYASHFPPPPSDLDELVKKGEDLFFNETFEGNGRTCGTCHPAANNFTIDAPFIATLPSTDPLFVAEFVPALAENFENPTLMRSLGLIKENLDGFDDLANKFVMRGVPHTLALPTSLAPAPQGADGSTNPPDQRTGWSGDGAAGSGTLREFAIGAVTQHFPLTLGRVDGSDFRLPTDEELDAMAAFQLSLGRQEDLDLQALELLGNSPRRGMEIFLTLDTQGGTVAAGKCNLCHANAGAGFAGAPGGLNFNFDTGVEDLADQPADIIDPENNPPDGGFGTDPHPSIPGAFGNRTFNTPTLVEAADTGPFFHNNAVESLEAAVAFYDSQAFNDSPAGRFLAAADSGAIGIRLEATQVEAIVAFLRVINALENIRSALALQAKARVDESFNRLFEPAGDSPELFNSQAEIEDAIDVLNEAGLHLDAVAFLRAAEESTRSAISSSSSPGFVRNGFIDRARGELRAARDLMAR